MKTKYSKVSSLKKQNWMSGWRKIGNLVKEDNHEDGIKLNKMNSMMDRLMKMNENTGIIQIIKCSYFNVLTKNLYDISRRK